ncbi:MAG: dihydroxyacetone kinase subunit L [Bacteroidales bacterium]|nr:dihydroxyacetone kinase subunit L [Bacteroidales bacterium]
MEYFLNSGGSTVVTDMIRAIQENKDYLSKLDSEIGDGDHGINMNKGFTNANKKINEDSTFSESMKILSRVLIMEIGGAMGPLYGTFFKQLGDISRDKEQIDASLFKQMLEEAERSVQKIGEAKVGDKTLFDTLIPAVSAFSEAIDQGDTFSEALNKMSQAAEKGKDSTKDLVARVGRASRHGEKTRGMLDAGAASCYIILDSMAKSISKLLISD